jgi:exopolysaccharide production protein ExoZ
MAKQIDHARPSGFNEKGCAMTAQDASISQDGGSPAPSRSYRHADKPIASRSDPLLLVQVLRAVAALLVLVGHIQAQVIGAAAASGVQLIRVPMLPGGFGVDLFFTISGFIMVVSSSRLFGIPGARKTFLLRRAFRLVPLYWCVTTCFFFLLVWKGRESLDIVELVQALIKSLTFLPFDSTKFGIAGTFPLYDLGWSLNYEVFFYVLFSLFIILPISRAILGVSMALLAIVIIGLWAAPTSVALQFWSQPILLEFGLGVLIGYAWLRQSRKSGLWTILMVAVALVFVLLDPLGLSTKVAGTSTPNDLVRFVGWGLPAAAILMAAVFAERYRKIDLGYFSFMAVLGDCSYSLYLMHPFALMAIAKAWDIFELGNLVGWQAMAVAMMAGSVILALLSYKWIEKPATRWLHRHSSLS